MVPPPFDEGTALDSENTALDELVLIYSSAYFVVDSAVMVLYNWQLDFFLHHLGSVLTSGSVIYLGSGAAACWVPILWGEATNPLQCLFHVLEEAIKRVKGDNPWRFPTAPTAQACYKVVVVCFAAIFLPVRLFVGPAIGFFFYRAFYGGESGYTGPLPTVLRRFRKKGALYP